MLTTSGSTPFILNEVEGLTTCGSMSLTINRISEREIQPRFCQDSIPAWLTGRRWAIFEKIVDQINDVSNIDYAVAVAISGFQWIGRRA